MRKVSVIGLGYVGLPLLAAITKCGKYEAVGYDLNAEKINLITSGKCPIDDSTCAQDMMEKPISASTDDTIMTDSDIFIICVPTPVFDDYTPDYSFVEKSMETVAHYMKKDAIVVLESTVNPGTCEEICLPILEKVSGLKVGDFTLSHCPERINPGDPKWNVRNINRNIGSLPVAKVGEIADFYRSFIDATIKEVSCLKVAEATKIVENSFRDVNIAFVNELAQSFDAMGIDLIETLHGASNKPFGFMAHWPSRGVGGHCIAVDPYYLIKRAEKSGFNHRFLKAAREVNNSMPHYLVSRLQDALNEIELPVKGTKIGLLGLSYKANVADLRESPCLVIEKLLKAMGADLLVYDPYFPKLSNTASLDELLEKSTAVVIGTMHKEFEKISKVLSRYPNIRAIVDGMNKINSEVMDKSIVIYRGIGR